MMIIQYLKNQTGIRKYSVIKIVSLLVVLLFIFVLSVCSSEEDDIPRLEGKGTVSLSFDHWMMGGGVDEDEKIEMNPSSFRHTNSNEETLQELTTLDYIVSNISLKDETGKVFTYAKDSLFIVSEEHRETKVGLAKIPAGRYISVSFGIGVPYAKWAEGIQKQKELWEKAKRYSLALEWKSGYRHLIFEGKFTSRTVRNPQFFQVHIKDDTSDPHHSNYKKLVLPFPKPLLISNNLKPVIHFRVDINKILDGKNKIKLSKSPIISDGERIKKIADNFTDGMFKVDKID